jgi:hypothetical protein
MVKFAIPSTEAALLELLEVPIVPVEEEEPISADEDETLAAEEDDDPPAVPPEEDEEEPQYEKEEHVAVEVFTKEVIGNVTEPVEANKRPVTTPPFIVMLVEAKIEPANEVGALSVAEEATDQNTSQLLAPFVSNMLDEAPTINVDAH